MRRRLPLWFRVAVASVAPIGAGALISQFAGVRDQTNLAFAFLLLVLAAAVYGGSGAGVSASVTGFLTFNFFFIEPVRTLSVTTRRDLGILLGFLAVSLVVSSLVAGIESHRERAEREAEDTQLLFDLSVSLSDAAELGHEMREVAELAEQRLGFRAVAVVRSGRIDDVLHGDVLHDGGVPEHLLRLAIAGGAGDAAVAAAPLRGGGKLLLIGYTHGGVDDRRRGLLTAFAARAAAAAERRASQEERERMSILQETDRQRAALLASVSHDLRTPLAGIKSAASAIATSSSESERQLLAGSVASEVDRLDRMIRNLLDLSRIHQGVLTPALEAVPVDELVGTVLSRLRPAIGRRAMRVDVPGDLPPVLIDFVQIEQALTNLVENALQHTADSAALDISASTRPDWVTIRVANDGPGIPAEDHARIFRSFERGRSARPGGSGLGLAIARAFATASGGRVELAEGERTAFDLTLPVATP
ncbi:MAG: ATP-binding protein [Mycobacteriales bacterium]